MFVDVYYVLKMLLCLEILDVFSVGMSLDVFCQGQVWKVLQE